MIFSNQVSDPQPSHFPICSMIMLHEKIPVELEAIELRKLNLNKIQKKLKWKMENENLHFFLESFSVSFFVFYMKILEKLEPIGKF